MNSERTIREIRHKLFARADDKGQWIRTKNGNAIHINENGAIDKGNQFAMAVMGKPKGASMPKKSVKLKEEKPYKLSVETRESLGNALAKRKDKDIIFGGFYKVEQSGGTFKHATFFNPYTGNYFSETVDDDDDRTYNDPFYSELRKMRINEDAEWLWKRSNGIVQNGDKVKVTKGRTIAHGTQARVKSIRPYKDKYGRKVADYAYLDNGEKINVNNIEIVE